MLRWHNKVLHRTAIPLLKFTKIDRLLERIRVGLRAYRTQWFPLLIAFVGGLVVNAISDPSVRTLADAIKSIFGFQRPMNFVTWGIISLLVAIQVIDWLLAMHHRKKSYESLLARFLTGRTDQGILPFTKGVIAWGANLTLQSAPDLRCGWRLREVKIRYNGDNFVMPPSCKQRYQIYCKENEDEKRFFDDGDKFMLIKNPRAFSDTPTLVLELHKTKYSKVQFYRDNVATIKSERDGLLRKAVDELIIEFPHALCMHAVVITKDEKVLLTKRSPKVAYFPRAWSVSVEEQLSPLDFHGDSDGIMSRWGARLLWEELAVSQDEYDEDNFRLLSVFVEADILNCSLAALAQLNLTSEQLSNVLKVKPRTDYEFTDWRFVSFPDLGRELREPSFLPQHPTSGYRSLHALIKQWGIPRLAKVLFG